MTMVKGGTELLQDPVAQELLNSRIPARLAYNWTDGTRGWCLSGPLGWHRHRHGDAAWGTQAQGSAER